MLAAQDVERAVVSAPNAPQNAYRDVAVAFLPNRVSKYGVEHTAPVRPLLAGEWPVYSQFAPKPPTEIVSPFYGWGQMGYADTCAELLADSPRAPIVRFGRLREVPSTGSASFGSLVSSCP